MPSLSENDLYWVAGILEGEGSFGLGAKSSRAGPHKPQQLRITCSMTDLDIINRLHSTTQVGNVRPATTRPGHKQLWTWQCSKRDDAIWLMESLLPIMGDRRSERIQGLLDYAEQNPPVYGQPILCGTRRSYRKGCRCQLCKDEVARYARERRRAKRNELVQEDSD